MRPRVEKDFEGFIVQLHAVGEEMGRALRVVGFESAIDEASEGLSRVVLVSQLLMEIRGAFPFFQFLETLCGFSQEPTFGEAMGGFAGVLEGVFEDQGSLSEVAAALQGVGCGNPVSEKMRVDISGAAVTAESHFAVGDFAIAEAEQILEGMWNRPEFRWAGGLVAQVEVNGVRGQGCVE